jgi:hypothetical protein
VNFLDEASIDDATLHLVPCLEYKSSDSNSNRNRNVVIIHVNDPDWERELESYLQTRSFDVIVEMYLLNFSQNPAHLMGVFAQNSKTCVHHVLRYDFNVYSAYGIFHSLFNTNSFRALCTKSRSNIQISKGSRVDDEYIFETISSGEPQESQEAVSDLLLQELEREVYSEDTYTRLTLEAVLYRNTLQNIIIYYKLHEYDIVSVSHNTLRSQQIERMIQSLFETDRDICITADENYTAITEQLHPWRRYLLVTGNGGQYSQYTTNPLIRVLDVTSLHIC